MTKDNIKNKKEESEEPEAQNQVNDNQEDTIGKEEKKEDAKSSKNKQKRSSKDSKIEETEQLGLKLQEINDKYLRLSAEFDNYRKRTLKEKMELTKSAGEKILINILPVLDNFERALTSMNDSSDLEATKEGIQIIYKNFKDFVIQNGVKEIDTENKEFDTDIHEAITKIPAPSEDLKGKVVDCVEKGYYLNEKVIRFAKVVVGE